MTQLSAGHGTEEQCRAALFRWRWLNGSVGSGCSQTVPRGVQSRAPGGRHRRSREDPQELSAIRPFAARSRLGSPSASCRRRTEPAGLRPRRPQDRRSSYARRTLLTPADRTVRPCGNPPGRPKGLADEVSHRLACTFACPPSPPQDRVAAAKQPNSRAERSLHGCNMDSIKHRAAACSGPAMRAGDGHDDEIGVFADRTDTARRWDPSGVDQGLAGLGQLAVFGTLDT